VPELCTPSVAFELAVTESSTVNVSASDSSSTSSTVPRVICLLVWPAAKITVPLAEPVKSAAAVVPWLVL
jgi:hypothetical protein